MDNIQISDDLVQEAIEDQLDPEHQPVDPDNPGFGSLLSALQQTLEGQLDPGVLATYRTRLLPRLEQSREQLAQMVVPESIRAQVAPAMKATEVLLDELGAVLDLVGEFLELGSEDSLEEAISLLDGVHDQLRQVF